jgi:hypothetical protein
LFLTTHLFTTNCNLSGHTNYVPESIFYHQTEDWRAGELAALSVAVQQLWHLLHSKQSDDDDDDGLYSFYCSVEINFADITHKMSL